MNTLNTLDARDVSKSFPGVRALHDVSITLAAGRVHALLGENGAGKSTLVKILTGSQHADAGSITIDGEAVRFGSPRDAIDKGVASVHQELTILPEMTVLDNVMLGHEHVRAGILDMSAQRAEAMHALQRVRLDDLKLSTTAGDLSLANRQLLEIARALVRRSRVIILDEPSAVLSGDKLEALHAVVRSLAQDGVAVLYISHLLDEVDALADDVTVLRDGERISTGPAAEYDHARIVREMVGRNVEAVFPASSPPSDEVVLDVTGLVPSRSGARSTDLQLRRGEIVGLSGLVGSGRSRLLRTIAGARGRATGSIRVGGRVLKPGLRHGIRAGVVLVPEERKREGLVLGHQHGIRAGVVLVPEERKREGLVLGLPVAANLTLTALRSISRAGWLRPRLEDAAFDEQRDRFRIRASGPRQITQQLSGGNQQKVVLAKWIRTQPTVLLLDEPTRGVDVGAKGEIYDIIVDLAESGLAIVIASSELAEVVGLSHRVLVCRGGDVVGGVDRAPDSAERIMELSLGASR